MLTPNCYFIKYWKLILNQSPLNSQNVETNILGPSKTKHKDLFDENDDDIKQMPYEKYHLHQTYLRDPKFTLKKDAFNTICSTVQQKLYQIQESSLSNKANVIQGYTNWHDMKNLMKHWKKSMAPSHQDHPMSWVQMEPHWSLTNRRYWKGELNTSTVTWIILHPSVV